MKKFKTESKRILDLMINSIYTNKEIFLRELISNASDAIDKLHFRSLTDSSIDSDFKIEIIANDKARTLTIRDNGIGMTEEELEKNLGTIAQSGTLAFKLESEEKTDLIGQFGVGFYSAFMVAEKIEVVSKAYGSAVAYKWTSEGVEGYNIEAAEKDSYGTTITLTLKEKDEDFDYDELLREHYLRMLVKKYSDYIRYPIVMEVTKSRVKEGVEVKEGETPEYETYREMETLNSRTPLWKKAKADITTEQYNEFYKNKFHDFTDPNKVFHFSLEGSVSYTAMLFIPGEKPYNYYQKDYQKGLQLYSNGVLIMDKCEQLLPDCYGFIKGIVDSSDLSLNISRETLQQDRQLRAIAGGIEKKITAELKKYMENDREGYEKFFAELGLSVKFGVYNDYGLRKDALKDLLLFHSSKQNKLVSLAEYVANMSADQQFIYYACGDSVENIDKLPQTELLKEKGYEILYMPDSVDEFIVKTLVKYDDKEFKSVGAKDLGLDTEAQKQEMERKQQESKALCDAIAAALDGEVKEVRLSARLKNTAFCLTADGEISLEMEKVFKAMKTATAMPVIAEKVLEINPDHALFSKLQSLYESDLDTLNAYAKVIFTQAMLTEGMPIDDPAAFVATLTGILSK